jgi:hypothetical protein
MRLSKKLVPWLAVATACSAFAAEPVAPGDPDPLPSLPATRVKPRVTNPDVLQLDEPVPRPGTPPSLLPNDIPPAGKRPGFAQAPAGGKPGPIPKQVTAGVELELRIRYRKARNIADVSEKVRAAWDSSRNLKNDYAKRQALKRYYEVLFAQMLAVDRGIAPLVEQRRKAEIAALTQTQIAPTVPRE